MIVFEDIINFNKKNSGLFGKEMKAFSLVEILLSVGILSILLALSFPVGLDFYKTQQLDSHTQGIIQALRKAQLKAMAVETDSSFGVYITNHNYILFKGSSFNQRDDKYDEIYFLPNIVNVIDSPKEIIFSKFEGKSLFVGEIILNVGGQSRVIKINSFGAVSL